MTNIAAFYDDIEYDTKNEVIRNLSHNGKTKTNLVHLRCKQTNKSAHKPIFIDELTTELLNAEIQKGFDDIKEGRLCSSNEVDSILHSEYNI